MANWKSIEDFYNEEVVYYKYDITKYYKFCSSFDFKKVTKGWSETTLVKRIPNLKGTIHRGVKGLDEYMDHFFSFKDSSGKIFWIVCPYTQKDKETIINDFKANNIKAEIYDSFYPKTVTIVLDPLNVKNGCKDYSIYKEKDKYIVIEEIIWKCSAKKLASFNTKKEAEDYMQKII